MIVTQLHFNYKSIYSKKKKKEEILSELPQVTTCTLFNPLL